MRRYIRGFIALGSILTVTPPLMAIDTAVVERGKQATALIELPHNRGSGSAVCIDPGGYFLTSRHVIEAARGGKCKLIVYPGTKKEFTVTPTVLRSDKESDLALLKIPKKEGLTPLALGRDDKLTETMEVIAFGYPFGKALAFKDKGYPSVTVTTGRITSIRTGKDGIEALQVDADVNPGSSGGALTDTKGRILGIVAAGVYGSAVNLAIPVSEARRFLTKPDLVAHPPTLTRENVNAFVRFSVEARTPANVEADLSLELNITADALPTRTIPMKRGEGGVYHSEIRIAPEQKDGAKLLLAARLGDDMIRCRVADAEISVAGTAQKLSEVVQITLGPKPTVIRSDGKTLEGEITGLNEVWVELGSEKLRLDLSKATSISLTNPADVKCVAYIITAKERGKTLAELRGALRVKGAARGGLGDGLVLHYTFDQDERQKVTDKTSLGNNGEVRNAKWANAGIGAGAYRFAGAGDHIDCGSGSGLDDLGGEFSISAWIYPESAGQHGSGRIVSKRGSGGGFDFNLEQKEGVGLRLWIFLHAQSGDDGIAINVDGVVFNEWQHVVALFDSDRIPHLYINGKEVSSYEHQKEWSNKVHDHSSVNMFIGSNIGRNRSFDGMIDEVRVYDRALTADEVAELHRAGAAWLPRERDKQP